jgi:AraC-like DNA-binding protein
LPRHRHTAGYATVVLAGSFEEAGFAGRFVVQPGDVLLHGAFDCHANRAVSSNPVKILRLPWSDNLLEGRCAVRDPDALAGLVERDVNEAAARLRQGLILDSSGPVHWAEHLAADLRADASICLGEWAESRGLAPETVSRGFHKAFGVPPKVFRIEARARRAWNALLRTTASLTTVAHDLGFADLAHLSRAVGALTGAPPRFWRTEAAAAMPKVK